jgi:hypothetical protein
MSYPMDYAAQKAPLSANYDLDAGRRALTVEPTASGPFPSAVTPLTVANVSS